MLDTLFDKIYVIWGRDPARKEYIQNHFKQCNIENYISHLRIFSQQQREAY